MHRVTITGDLGSGKSIIGKLLSQKLGYNYFSTGSFQRELANQYKMTTLELNKYAESNPEIDYHIDNKIKDTDKLDKDFIIDSRMAWFFIPKSFKIYLKINSKIAAQRIIADNNRLNEPQYSNIENAMQKISSRKNSENKRFLEIYKADCANLDNFDLIVDTSFATPQEILNIILSCYDEWLTKNNNIKYWLSPKNIFPTKSFVSINNKEIGHCNGEIKTSTFNAEHPLEVIYFEDQFFVTDGHKRLSASLYNLVNFIPCKRKIAGQQEITDIILNNVNESLIKDWEEVHKFTFVDYPAFVKNGS